MRILHIVPTYLPATRYGGPIHSVHGLCRALAGRGHDVSVVTTNADGDGFSDVPLDQPVDLEGVSVRYFATTGSKVVPPPLARRLYFAPRMAGYLREAVQQADVAHLHSVFLWPVHAAARAAADQHLPYVISPRGMLVPDLIRARSRVAKTLWLQLVERRNFERASGVHLTSERELADARGVRIPLPHPFIVPNGVDVPQSTSVLREDTMLLFLGRISWKKRIDLLISALPTVPQARLEIAGNDEEDEVPRLRDLASRLQVADRVTFHGHVQGAEKAALLARASVFVLTSLNENFGNAVLEAMAAGVPVIVSPEVGLSAEVSRSGSGLVVPADTTSLATSLNRLLADEGLRHDMGAAGRRAVEERYTWPRIAAEMESHYERLLR